MNKFKIKVVGDVKIHLAEKKANAFIDECNAAGKRILEVSENFSREGAFPLYSFIFKVEE